MNYSYDDQYAALLLFLGRTLGIIIAKSSVPGLGEAGKPALTLLRAKGCHEQGGGGGFILPLVPERNPHTIILN